MSDSRLLQSMFVKSSVVFFVIALISGCGGSTKTTDVTPPSVVSMTPTNGQIVPLNPPISVTFTEGIIADAFTVVSQNGIPLPGTVTGMGTATVTFTPSASMIYNTKYKATIYKVRDGSGNKLGDVSWSFTSQAASLNYHITPDSHDYDVGQYNSIAISPVDGTSYISYFNATKKSLFVVSTVDGTTFEGPVMVAGPGGTEKVGEYSSLAVDGAGHLHISYYHEGSGAEYATASSIAGPWGRVSIDNGGGTATVGKFTSLALDGNSKPHVSYYDETNTALKYATNANGTWMNETVDTGLPADNPGRYSSIKVGTDGLVHISYYDYHDLVKNGNLKYVVGNAGNWSPAVTLDSTGDVGQFSSLALFNGMVYIAYNHVYPDGSWFIRVITNASGEWKHLDFVEVSPTSKAYTGLTANPLAIDSTGVLHVSYYKNGALYYSTGILYDAALNMWDWSVAQAVDTSEIGPGVYTSLAVDSSGKVGIAYYDLTDHGLKVAR